MNFPHDLQEGDVVTVRKVVGDLYESITSKVMSIDKGLRSRSFTLKRADGSLVCIRPKEWTSCTQYRRLHERQAPSPDPVTDRSVGASKSRVPRVPRTAPNDSSKVRKVPRG